jgi:integrase
VGPDLPYVRGSQVDVTTRLAEFEKYIASRKSKATGDTYRRAALKFERFLAEKDIPLEHAAPGVFDLFVTWLMEHSQSPASIELITVGAQIYVDWRRRNGEVFPTFAKPDKPKIEYREPFILNLEQLGQFFKFAGDIADPGKTALSLMPLSGLRSEEMASLRLTDLETRNGWVIFHVVGKGRKRRVVPLLKQGNPILRRYLMGWRARYPRPSSFLFPNNQAGFYPTRSLRRHLEGIREAMGLSHEERFGTHALRKTYMTLLDSFGVSPFKIAQIGGHKKVETTRDHYVHHGVDALTLDLGSVHAPVGDRDDEKDDDE